MSTDSRRSNTFVYCGYYVYHFPGPAIKQSIKRPDTNGTYLRDIVIIKKVNGHGSTRKITE
jgi:hypothetical protein